MIRARVEQERRSRLTSCILAALAIFAAVRVQPCLGADPLLCVGTNLSVGTFRLLITPPEGGPALPMNSVNMIQPGDSLKYEPVHFPPGVRNKAKIALVLVPSPESSRKGIEVLAARPADKSATWKIPVRASVIGVVFGPRGLDLKKVTALVKKNPELLPELARYAKQSATVNALVETLSGYDQSRPGSEDLNAVLKGFSAQYSVALPQIDPKAPTDEQAALLLHAVLPSLDTYNPLESQRSLVVEQSAGLAAAVATLFYGTPVGLAAGGAQLLENLRLMMSPGTDFRAAFTQPAGAGGVQLCSSKTPPKPRTRIAYLWMLQVPDAGPPSVSIPKVESIAAGTASFLPVTCATHKQLTLLTRARDWKLVSAQDDVSVPVHVIVGASGDKLSLDLSHLKPPAGDYHLAAVWDWNPLRVSGIVQVRHFSNFGTVRPAPDSEDHLIQGAGATDVRLIGADFEFVRRVAIVKSGEPEEEARPVPFRLAKGFGAGEQLALKARVDTAVLSSGVYRLLLTQSNGNTQSVLIKVHPPDPKLENLPLRANLGLKQQILVLRGTGLSRIEQITSPDASWILAPATSDSNATTERQAIISLGPKAREGDYLHASLSVEGLNQPIEIPEMVAVAGPLPAIVNVRESFLHDGNVALRQGELPAGAMVSFAITAKNAGSRPTVALGCGNGGVLRPALKLQPGDRSDTSQLDYSGQGLLFLSLEPGMVGQSGCVLTASVVDANTGSSTPYVLGRVIRLPQISKFTLTDEKSGDGLYQGLLTGRDLQTIEETGWNNHGGYPVQGIPTPVPGNPQEQTLKIELPWPPPSPNAPVYVWLLGETRGRRTRATY